MKVSLVLLFLLPNFGLSAQINTFSSGEKLVYTASYNMSGILTDLAQVTMQTSEVKTSKNTLLHLKCTAATFKRWDGFFKIRDLYESYVSPKTLRPYLYKRDISEGGYYKFMQYSFDYTSKSIKSLKRKKRRDGTTWDENKTLDLSSGTKDLVSTLYYIRTLDIDKANPGDQQDYIVLFDNTEQIINIQYLGKETISTTIGKKDCYKLAISLKNNNLLKGKSDNLLWLTADANKVPVYAKFKIPVGNGELKIVSATGLKN